jgi:AcrR family transcriptional regulator
MLKSVPDDSGGNARSGGVARRRDVRGPGAPGRSGRRPAGSGTREAILATAQRQFAEFGYDRASLRSIAAEAGVDQKLITYFFSTKRELFVAAVDMTDDGDQMVPRTAGGDIHTLGEQIARFMVEMLEAPAFRDRIVGLVRAAMAEPAVAQKTCGIRERIVRIFGPTIADAFGPAEAEVRIGMINSQLFGLVMARYIVGAGPLASLPPDELAAFLAPALQHYVNGPVARS